MSKPFQQGEEKEISYEGMDYQPPNVLVKNASLCNIQFYNNNASSSSSNSNNSNVMMNGNVELIENCFLQGLLNNHPRHCLSFLTLSLCFPDALNLFCPEEMSAVRDNMNNFVDEGFKMIQNKLEGAFFFLFLSFIYLFLNLINFFLFLN